MEAAREAERTGEMVPKDFFQIPVHSALEGRFVYAVPRGHTPVAEDLDRLREAANILREYRTRRPHYVNDDGTLRAVDLIRELDHTSLTGFVGAGNRLVQASGAS